MVGCLDLDGLRAFVAIAESMSFSRAGEVIGRSQSAVSLRLSSLERSLGVLLVSRRQGRVIDLTDHGHKLLDYARQIIVLNDAALHDLAELPARSSVHLGVPADFIGIEFSQALLKVQALLGDVRLDVVTDVSDRLRSRCMAGELDVVFYKMAEPDGVGTPLQPVPLTWFGAPGMSVDLRGKLPLVCFPEGCVYRQITLQSLDAAKIAHQLAFVSPSLDALRMAVRSGLGVTALPSSVLGPEDGLAPLRGLPGLGGVILALAVAPGDDPIIRRAADLLSESVSALDIYDVRRRTTPQTASTSMV